KMVRRTNIVVAELHGRVLLAQYFRLSKTLKEKCAVISRETWEYLSNSLHPTSIISLSTTSNTFHHLERTSRENPSAMLVGPNFTTNQTVDKPTDGQSAVQTHEAAARQESATTLAGTASDRD
ncbi:MAG: hypothetical protein P8Q90_04135, partial [Candidatus Thalassarchaeaceae archaeon]|nr:hypothetical protein [Candidatus Thalassarchaeaceae archaeon]